MLNNWIKPILISIDIANTSDITKDINISDGGESTKS
jgi:hypothetical protein